MATETTTIRVPRDTRDLLASQARERGVSLSSLLTKIAQRETRDAIFKAERQASLGDQKSIAVIEETKDWEATTGDGIE